MRDSLSLYYQLIKKDSNGKVIKNYRKRKCHSFVRQFSDFLRLSMSHSSARNVTDISNTVRSVTSYSFALSSGIPSESP